MVNRVAVAGAIWVMPCMRTPHNPRAPERSLGSLDEISCEVTLVSLEFFKASFSRNQLLCRTDLALRPLCLTNGLILMRHQTSLYRNPLLLCCRNMKISELSKKK